jgi:very-short-patch-repair endonuclease
VPPPTELEVGTRRGVPTTGASRTIVDCAGILGRRELGDLIEGAALRKALRIERIDRILDGPRRRGARKLLRALEPWRRYKPGVHLRSRMEAKLLPLLSERGLPIPETSARLRAGGKAYEVDFLWRGHWVVVETDGRASHDNPVAGERDSERTRPLLAAGYSIPRLGWEDLRDRPAPTMDEIAYLLGPGPPLKPRCSPRLRP